MACVPIVGRRKQYHFEAVVKLHSLLSVPYVNAVTFAKLRLVGSRHSSQYSPRVEIRNHTVSWNTQHRFFCKFRTDPETKVLEPNVLKISIRMETKGGKSFYKVGFVSINLACFTALGNVTSRRRFILEGYNDKHKRLDNSLLLVSVSMRQLLGDTCFRPPPENLSNCLIEPLDSDDGDYSTGTNPRGDKPGSLDSAAHDVSATVGNTVVNSNACLPTSTSDHTASIDRILEAISSNSAEFFPSTQLSRPTSAHSATTATQLTSFMKSETGDQLPGSTILRSVLQCTGESRLTPGLSGANQLSQDQISGLISKVLSSQTSFSDSIRSMLNSHLVRSTEEETQSASARHSEVLALSPSDSPVVHEHSSAPVSLITAPTDICPSDAQSSVVSENASASDTTLSTTAALACSSSSGTHTSKSTTPSTTPGSSPFHSTPFTQNPELRNRDCGDRQSISDNVQRDFSIQYEKSPELSTTVYESFDTSTCHSLPLPPNYSARRREATAPNSTSPPSSSRCKFPDHFATDSGLLLPSRRRKSRPMAHLVFPDKPSVSINQVSGLTSAYDSNSGLIPELQGQQLIPDSQRIFRQPQHGVISRTAYPSTGGDSRSSGYQSHSRQSSLESQPTGSNTVLISTSLVTNPPGSVSVAPTESESGTGTKPS